jgi:hypothetical protein
MGARQGMAFEQAMGLVWYYIESNLTMSRMGSRTLIPGDLGVIEVRGQDG